MSLPQRERPEPGRATLERALDRVCGARAIPGNRVAHLIDGPHAYGRMLGLIEGAERWVHFENYIIRHDATGRIFAEHLIAAARRGVRVAVLYDHFGSFGTARGYWRRLRRAGVEVRAFNRVHPLHLVRSVRRDHRKYLGVDGTQAILGGICIGDQWAGEPPRRPPWRDDAIELCGPTVPALEHAFLRLWRAAGGAEPGYTPPTRVDVCGGAAVRIVEGLPGKLRLYRAIALLAAGATSRLWVTDAYLVAATPLFATIIAAARDGIDVRLLLPGKSDLPAIRTLTRVGYRELLEAGVRIWEWHGPMLHAKTVIADDVWFKIGSSNLNPSSLVSNYELDILLEDRGAAASAIQQFRRDLAGAVEVVLKRRRLPERLAPRLPPAVVSTEPRVWRGGPRRARGELTRRAAVTLRQVAGGARRSVAGAVIFASLGAGALLVAWPRVMAYVLATLCFGLGAVAGWHFLELRRYRDD